MRQLGEGQGGNHGRMIKILQDVLHELDSTEGLYVTDRRGIGRLWGRLFPTKIWRLRHSLLIDKVERLLSEERVYAESDPTRD